MTLLTVGTPASLDSLCPRPGPTSFVLPPRALTEGEPEEAVRTREGHSAPGRSEHLGHVTCHLTQEQRDTAGRNPLPGASDPQVRFQGTPSPLEFTEEQTL